MHPTPQAHAVLLPTLSFGKSDAGNARPLSNSEWARFAVWLRDHDLAPASLLDSGWRDLVAGSTDSAVPLGRLESEGTAVGVLADGPLRSATSAKYRQHLVSNDLALVTPFSPEARFHVGNAMSRNKYIYCLADVGVAVCSTPERGGTWHGAVENLKAARVPLWVKRNDSEASGNSGLVERGARWLPARVEGPGSPFPSTKSASGSSRNRCGTRRQVSGAGRRRC